MLGEEGVLLYFVLGGVWGLGTGRILLADHAGQDSCLVRVERCSCSILLRFGRDGFERLRNDGVDRVLIPEIDSTHGNPASSSPRYSSCTYW